MTKGAIETVYLSVHQPNSSLPKADQRFNGRQSFPRQTGESILQTSHLRTNEVLLTSTTSIRLEHQFYEHLALPFTVVHIRPFGQPGWGSL